MPICVVVVIVRQSPTPMRPFNMLCKIGFSAPHTPTRFPIVQASSPSPPAHTSSFSFLAFRPLVPCPQTQNHKKFRKCCCTYCLIFMRTVKKKKKEIFFISILCSCNFDFRYFDVCCCCWYCCCRRPSPRNFEVENQLNCSLSFGMLTTHNILEIRAIGVFLWGGERWESFWKDGKFKVCKVMGGKRGDKAEIGEKWRKE